MEAERQGSKPDTGGSSAGEPGAQPGGQQGEPVGHSPPVLAAPSTAEQSNGSSSSAAVSCLSFDEPGPDGTFLFHVITFSKQLYVWVGFHHDSPQGPLLAAMPTRFDPMPLSTPLLGGGADAEGASMACRLAKRAGRGVLLAYGLPPNSPGLQAFAEKRLAREIDAIVGKETTPQQPQGSSQEPV